MSLQEAREGPDDICRCLSFHGQLVRHRCHGEGVRTGAHQDPTGPTADGSRGGCVQYRISTGHQHQHPRGGARPADPAVHGLWSAGARICRVLDVLPPDVRLLEAWWPDFGSCLYGAIDQLLELGHTSAVVLNSDSPTLPTSLLVATAEMLAQPGDRAVLGPSTDGGYYLLGLKSRHRRLFQDIAWSTDQVAGQTLARAAEIGLAVHLLPAWYDVDDAQSLSVLYGELFEDRPFARGLDRHRAAFSARLMRTLLARNDLAARLDIISRPSLAVATG